MIVKLLTEHLLEVLSLKGSCTCSSESTLVKMPHCWQSHVTSYIWKIFPFLYWHNYDIGFEKIRGGVQYVMKTHL